MLQELLQRDKKNMSFEEEIEKTTTESVYSRVELHGKLSEFRQALEDEIDEIESSKQSSTLLLNGRRISNIGTDFRYRFSVEYLPTILPDTPCTLIVGKDSFDVTVIRYDGNAIELSARLPLPETIASARLENGVTVLLKRLIKRIETNSSKKNTAGDRMLASEDQNTELKYARIANYDDICLEEKNKPEQDAAIRSALANDITYIWGPPGTGKTTVISQIINELLKHDRSVLLVSHTNTAVDGAIKGADKKYAETHSVQEDQLYPILRMGFPSIDLPDRLLLKSHIRVLGQELYDRQEELENQKIEHQKRINVIQPQIDKAKWVQDNQLTEIARSLGDLKSIVNSTTELEHNRTIFLDSLEHERIVHPEYCEFMDIRNAFSAQEEKCRKLQLQLEKSEQSYSVLSQEIQTAKDEVVKHEKFVELQLLKSRHFSMPAQKEQISKVSEQIKQLNNEKQMLLSQKASDERTVADYNQKSAFAKLFIGRSATDQANNRLEKAKMRLIEVIDTLQAKQRVEQEYRKQLEELQYIQEQIAAIALLDTKDDWLRRITYKTALLNKVIDERLKIQADLYVLRNHLHSLSTKLDVTKSAYETVTRVENALANIETKLQDKRIQQSQLRSELEKALKAETALCISFCTLFDIDEPQRLYDMLYDKFGEIRTELLDVDTSSLETELHQINEALLTILKELSELNVRMQQLEKQVILQAKVIGTTLTKAYLSDTIQERTFDTAILDEASMASIPTLWCASYLAEKNIIIVGDFLQLPPIVMAETPIAEKWLGRDIFDHSGVQKIIEKRVSQNNIAKLNSQFRMEAEIANIANLYYGQFGELKSDDSDTDRVKARMEFYQWCGGDFGTHSVHMIDTESLHAWVTGIPQGKSHSRLNCFSASLVVALAFKLIEKRLPLPNSTENNSAKEPLILIVVPYKPHAVRVKQLIDFEYKARGYERNLDFIHAGTIHNFQGREADIVIFDLVIDEPHWKANLFMPDKTTNGDLQKMFNVAITRARFKLFFVGNFAYCQKKAKDNTFGKLLKYLLDARKLPKIEANELFPDLVYVPPSVHTIDSTVTGKHIICQGDSFDNYFMEDIKTVNEKLLIYSPFITENRLSTLLPYFADAVHRGCKIVVVTKAMSEREGSQKAQYRKCEKELESYGIKIIHKKGMHEKHIFVDDTIVWTGSLNALSFGGTSGETVERRCNKELAEAYSETLDVKHIWEVALKIEEQKCPICNGEMLAAESDSGGIYWTCTNKDYSRKPTQQYPTDGVLRCSKCNAPYTFFMKGQPRWVCSVNSKHYQRMHEGDLKLKKMLALIPTKNEQDTVRKYFIDTRKKEGTFIQRKKSTSKGTHNKTKVDRVKIESPIAEQIKLFD